MLPPISVTNNVPDYCCAIITDRRGYLLLQLRPPTARHAPGLLTCFGGRREAHESTDACLQRELREELGWSPGNYDFACDLWRDSTLIARFFRCDMPALVELKTEQGHRAIWTPISSLQGLPISPWHKSVFDALARGHQRAEVPT